MDGPGPLMEPFVGHPSNHLRFLFVFVDDLTRHGNGVGEDVADDGMFA